ncbi:YczE/YyaS/YitT family protein [Halalkalibacter lacteus]|uniref:YczE/YyaS/YitT family protein n=1 Tax=Halalkalibacter lacteus TaxID=3090663 RepID=UPI002FC5CF0B
MGKRIAIYIIGLMITSFGIALIISSGVGAGPWDTVAVGLNMHLGLTIGLWSIIAQGLVVFVTWAIERERIQYEAVVAIIIRSVFLDVWIYGVLRNVDFGAFLGMSWLALSLGILCVGVGIGIYIESRLPRTPLDGLMIALHNRFGWSLNISRVSIECSGAIIGFLLGGPVGVGTVLIAATLGRVVQFSNLKFKKVLTTHHERQQIRVQQLKEM